MVDLDAIKAMWRGFDAPLSAAYDEDAEEWVITSADDGSPYIGVLARMECDYAEQLGTLWGGAGPQVAALVAEVERLRAIVEGRTTWPEDAPTDAELDHIECAGYRLVAAFDGSGEPVRWWVIRDGRLCAWPEVPRG